MNEKLRLMIVQFGDFRHLLQPNFTQAVEWTWLVGSTWEREAVGEMEITYDLMRFRAENIADWELDFWSGVNL